MVTYTRPMVVEIRRLALSLLRRIYWWGILSPFIASFSVVFYCMMHCFSDVAYCGAKILQWIQTNLVLRLLAVPICTVTTSVLDSRMAVLLSVLEDIYLQ